MVRVFNCNQRTSNISNLLYKLSNELQWIWINKIRVIIIDFRRLTPRLLELFGELYYATICKQIMPSNMELFKHAVFVTSLTKKHHF